MDWVFPGFLIVSLAHMAEEYVVPGGFTQTIQRLNPRFAPLLTVPAVIIINGLQLLLCVLAWALGRNLLALSLSVAGLLAVNALVHLAASIRTKGYVPGVATGLALYLPLSIYTYAGFTGTGELSSGELIVSFALGILFNAVPAAYFVLGTVLRRAR